MIGSRSRPTRRGLATLEMVLSVPILLLVSAALFLVAQTGLSRTRSATNARREAWIPPRANQAPDLVLGQEADDVWAVTGMSPSGRVQHGTPTERFRPVIQLGQGNWTQGRAQVLHGSWDHLSPPQLDERKLTSWEELLAMVKSNHTQRMLALGFIPDNVSEATQGQKKEIVEHLVRDLFGGTEGNLHKLREAIRGGQGESQSAFRAINRLRQIVTMDVSKLPPKEILQLAKERNELLKELVELIQASVIIERVKDTPIRQLLPAQLPAQTLEALLAVLTNAPQNILAMLAELFEQNVLAQGVTDLEFLTGRALGHAER